MKVITDTISLEPLLTYTEFPSNPSQSMSKETFLPSLLDLGSPADDLSIFSPFTGHLDCINPIESNNWETACPSYDQSSLPDPTPAGLAELTTKLGGCVQVPESFISALVQEFKKNRDPATLRSYAAVFRLLAKNEKALGTLLNDSNYLVFFEAQEFAFPGQNFRETLSRGRFQNILNITDPYFLRHIRKAHRLGFLRNSAILICPDHQATMDSLQKKLWEQILQYYMCSQSTSKALKARLAAGCLEGFGFLCELARLARGVSVSTRQQLYEGFVSAGLLGCAYENLEHPRVRVFFREVVQSMFETSQGFALDYLLRDLNSRQIPVLIVFCKQALEEVQPLTELSQLFRGLLSCVNDRTYSALGYCVYDSFLRQACLRLESGDLEWTEEVLRLIQNCDDRSKIFRGFVLQNDLINRLMQLAKVRQLALTCVQTLASIFRRDDPKIVNCLVRLDTVRFLFDLWGAHADKEDAVFSAVSALVGILGQTARRKMAKEVVHNSQTLSAKMKALCRAPINQCFELLTQHPKKIKLVDLMNTCDFINEEDLPCKRLSDLEETCDFDNSPYSQSKERINEKLTLG